MITKQQIKWLRKHATAIGSSRLALLCEEGQRLVELYDANAAGLAPVKALGRELPFQKAAALKHNLARQNTSAECTTCGTSGSVTDGPAGLKLTGAIFSQPCSLAKGATP